MPKIKRALFPSLGFWNNQVYIERYSLFNRKKICARQRPCCFDALVSAGLWEHKIFSSVSENAVYFIALLTTACTHTCFYSGAWPWPF